MIYQFNTKLIREENHNKINDFLNQISKYNIIIDDQTAEVFANFKLNYSYNIDKEILLSMENLISVCDFLQKSVKYFSLSDVIKCAVSREDIPGSRANQIKQYLDNKTIVFNSYIRHSTEVEFIGENLYTQVDYNFTKYVSFQEFCSLLNKYCPNLYSVLLGAKILTSSFFFSEFVDVFGYNHKYSILNNRFFHSFNDFKNFAIAIGYSGFFSILDQQNSISEAIGYLKIKFNFDKFEPIPYVVFQKDNLFCNRAFIYHNLDKQNTQNFCKEVVIAKGEEPEERILFLDGEKSEMFQNSYDFYMQQVLQLKRKSINGLIIKNIYAAITQGEKIDINLIGNSNALEEFVTQIKTSSHVVENEILYQKNELFIAFNNYEINKIKTYSRAKGLLKIYIANFKTFTIEEFNLRKTKTKKIVKITY